MRWWRGDYVTVHENGRWSFHRCCACGKPLRDRESRRRGIGHECAGKSVTELDGRTVEQIVEERKERDRAKFKREVVDLGFHVGDGR